MEETMEKMTEDLKEVILKHLETKDINALKKILLDTSEHEILDVMLTLDEHEQAIVFRLLPKAKSLYVFENLETHDQEHLLGLLTHERAIELVEWLDPDDRVKLLDELPHEVTKKLIAKLSSDERAATNLLMGFEPETAGRIMTPNFVRLRRSLKASEALEKVRRKAYDHETIYSLYITDTKGKLEGIISLRKLLTVDPNEKLEDFMNTEFTSVLTSTDQESVARLLQKRDILAIPVVDNEGCMVGIITVDDAIDILEQEATEDIFEKAGLSSNESNLSETLIKGSLWSIWKIRLPFLLFTLVGGLIAGFVMGGFEEMLGTIIIAAFFIPVVLDMGGSTGVQSATIFTRASILGHIEKKKVFKHIARETFVGFTMGVFTGVLCGVAVFLWQGVIADSITTNEALSLTFAVGTALIVVMTLAAFIGFVVPYILIRLKIDQAAASGAIITTIKDISGLLIYFGLVYLFIGIF
jgi:magnesium transporter